MNELGGADPQHSCELKGVSFLSSWHVAPSPSLPVALLESLFLFVSVF